jgi:hypothetical protein
MSNLKVFILAKILMEGSSLIQIAEVPILQPFFKTLISKELKMLEVELKPCLKTLITSKFNWQGSLHNRWVCLKTLVTH